MDSVEKKGVATPKNNINQPIRKGLLTPCRRVGLSRKIKPSPVQMKCLVRNNNLNSNTTETEASPLSVQKRSQTKIGTEATAAPLNVKKKTDDLSSTSTKTEASPVSVQKRSQTKIATEETPAPLSIKKIDNISPNSTKIDASPITVQKRKQTKTAAEVTAEPLKKIKKTDNLDSNSTKTEAPPVTVQKRKQAKIATEEIAAPLNKIKKTECIVRLDVLTSPNIKEKKTEVKASTSIIQTDCTVRIDDVTLPNITGKKPEVKLSVQKCEVENSADTTVEKCTIKTKKQNDTAPKMSLKRLSMKKTSSNNDFSDCEDFESTTDIKKKLSQRNENKENISKVKINIKKSCIIESDDEELPKQVDNADIEEINKRIKMKQTQLSELKRAAGYKKLHNLEELKELTELWKTGLEKALAMLLTKLQGHGEITMSQLMKKMNIPESIINKK